MSNLDLLNTAVFLNKESYTDDEGHIEVLSRDFNQLFLDPYKSSLVNTAARLKMAQGNILTDCELNQFSAFSVMESIKSYVVSNTKDVLLSISSSFIDTLSEQFVYTEDSPYEDHYEFEFPYDLLLKNDKDIVTTAYDEILGSSLYTIMNYVLEADTYNGNKTDLTPQVSIGNLFDSFYARLLSEYFNELVLKITTFYISNPTLIENFYILDKPFSPFEKNGRNNAYNFISIALREMLEPLMENFKNCLFVMTNTTTSMLISYTYHPNTEDYETYLKTNPFVYEIMTKLYDIPKTEESDEPTVEVNVHKEESDDETSSAKESE